MGCLQESSWAGSAMVIALCCVGTSQPVKAQSTDPTRPGDLFSFSQIGQVAGQALKNDGIYLNAFYANDILGDVKGGNERGVTSTGDAHLGVDLDMNTIAGIPGAAMHVMFDDRTGNNVSSLAGTEFGLSGQNGPSDTVRLSEFSWDQSLLDDHVRLLFGRTNPALDFDTSDIACDFVSNITCGQPFAWYVNNSGVAFPVSTWGGRVTFKPTQPTYLRVGVYQDDATFNGVLEHGFDWGTSTSTGVFIPFEIGDQTSFSTARYPFQYDIGGYYDTGSYTLPAASGAADLNRRGRSAVYAYAQQTVWRPDPSTNRSLTVFGGVLAATGGEQTYPLSIYGGAYLRAPFASRPNDTVGFEAAYLTINKDAREQVGSTLDAFGLAAPDDSDEWIFEVNYGIAIAPGITVRPAAEYVGQPDEIGFSDPAPGDSDAFVIGAQVSINFNDLFGLPAWVRAN